MSARQDPLARFRSGEYPGPGRRSRPGQRSAGPRQIALLLAGGVLFGYPFLSLFAEPSSVLGIPALYLYLFCAWAAFIAAIAAMSGRQRTRSGRQGEDPQ